MVFRKVTRSPGERRYSTRYDGDRYESGRQDIYGWIDDDHDDDGNDDDDDVEDDNDNDDGYDDVDDNNIDNNGKMNIWWFQNEYLARHCR